ncbi:MAG TPA: TIGR04013 family B12-binding domain/radical SAM domain-containing protein [Candidatus Lokiarchaeia archaeon]|nr:TIGR04013 family B12-binding domain/radical SAM domain-containing protein [Candidatus Lokiarchaeia archaeon]
MIDPDTIYLQYGKQNKYSWASVIGILESRHVFEDYHLDLVTTRSSIESVLDRVQSSTANHHFFFFTVNSYHAHKILKSIQNVADFKTQQDMQEKVHVIAGGPHANVYPREIFDAGADYIFNKEGEIAIVDFFHEFYANASVRNAGPRKFVPSAVPNCYYMDPGTSEMNFTHPAPLVDLDDYPPIAIDHRMFRPIEITRGCPHGCYFCLTPQIFGYRSRHRSPENVICWVERAVMLKYRRVWFTAPNSFAYGSTTSKPNPPVVEKMLKGLKSIEGLEEIYFGTFPSEIRPEFVNNEILDAVAPYITNDTFVMGAQSASPRILKASHRGHTIEDVWNAIDILASRGYKIDIDMIFGLPGETSDDVALNIQFIKDVLEKPGTRIHGHAFMPLPGTAFEHESPGIIAPELAKIIGRYTKIGRVFGQHFHQVYRAARFAKLASESPDMSSKNRLERTS